MKKISLFVLFTGALGASNAQQSQNLQEHIVPVQNIKHLDSSQNSYTLENSTTSNKPTTISIRAGESQVTHDSVYYLNEIAKINLQIQAIDQKINAISNDPSENSLASQSGWFDQMESIKQDLNAKKALMQGHLEN